MCKPRLADSQPVPLLLKGQEPEVYFSRYNYLSPALPADSFHGIPPKTHWIVKRCSGEGVALLYEKLIKSYENRKSEDADSRRRILELLLRKEIRYGHCHIMDFSGGIPPASSNPPLH